MFLDINIEVSHVTSLAHAIFYVMEPPVVREKCVLPLVGSDSLKLLVVAGSKM